MGRETCIAFEGTDVPIVKVHAKKETRYAFKQCRFVNSDKTRFLKVAEKVRSIIETNVEIIRRSC